MRCNKETNVCFFSFNRKVYLTNKIFYNRLTATQIGGELEMSLDIISVRLVIPSYIEIYKLGIMNLIITLRIKYSASLQAE